jgi:hypothetical protein
MIVDVLDLKRAVAPAATSAGSTVVSFFAYSLPVVQWLSAVIAIVSGVLAIVWVVIQIRDRLRGRART